MEKTFAGASHEKGKKFALECILTSIYCYCITDIVLYKVF